ncbi:hypothetical protein [Undibacterium sp. SXout20W]|uniref:hypothetical protein n=1 Tax=Undibacterium sp. SXout20W TaxID=3413051 RepID=UPI003BF172C7
MPLNHNGTKTAISQNIKLIVDEWQQSGHIGSSHPHTKSKAVQQAVAIALSTADRDRKKTDPS